MGDQPEVQSDEEAWQEHLEKHPGAIASGDQTAEQARNWAAYSFVAACNLFNTGDLTEAEVRERFEQLPVIDCTHQGDEVLTIEEVDRRIELVREARDAGEAPPPHTVLDWQGWPPAQGSDKQELTEENE